MDELKEILARLKEEWDKAEYVEDFDEGHIEDLFKVAKHYEEHIDWMLTKPSRAETNLLSKNEYYLSLLEKAVGVMQDLQEAEDKYNLYLPDSVNSDMEDFLQNFKEMVR